MAARSAPAGPPRVRELRDHPAHLARDRAAGSIALSNGFAHRPTAGTTARRADDRGAVRGFSAAVGRHLLPAVDGTASAPRPLQPRCLRGAGDWWRSFAVCLFLHWITPRLVAVGVLCGIAGSAHAGTVAPPLALGRRRRTGLVVRRPGRWRGTSTR